MAFASARSALLALVAGALPSLAMAQQEPRDYLDQRPAGKGEGTQFAQKAEETKVKPDDNTPYQVRCWQNGVKILDEADWRSPQLQARFVAMKPMNGSEPGLYLVDFFNTFCELRKR
jgi:hypothetical protein